VFELFSLIDLVLVGVVAFTDVQLQMMKTIALPERGSVVATEFRPATAVWNKTHNCRYYGLAIPFTRDWDEESGGAENKVVRPAEPDKLAGYAFIVNKLQCPDEEAQFVFNVGDKWRDWKAGAPLIKSMHLASFALRPDPAMQPKWLPQVMQTIEKAAEKDPVAKEFLDFNKAAEVAAKAKKDNQTVQKSGE
jgi:hypothetical protein